MTSEIKPAQATSPSPPIINVKFIITAIIFFISILVFLVDFTSPVAKEMKGLNTIVDSQKVSTDVETKFGVGRSENSVDDYDVEASSKQNAKNGKKNNNAKEKNIPSPSLSSLTFERVPPSDIISALFPTNSSNDQSLPFSSTAKQNFPAMNVDAVRAPNQKHQSNDFCFQEKEKEFELMKEVTGPHPPEKIKEYLKNVVLMHMVSPTRYNLVPLMYKHYLPYFTHQIFTGPKSAQVPGVSALDEPDAAPSDKQPPFFTIEGHDVVAGTMQYVALANVISRIEALTTREERIAAGAPPDGVEGYMFLGDDLILQPWNLYGRNKKVAWASGMGIANSDNWKPVAPVKSMAMEKKRLKGNWPFWFKGRVKMLQVYNDSDIDQEARDNIVKAYALTPPGVFRESHYSDPERLYCCSPRCRAKQVFYTIVDCFYVPGGRTAIRWAKFANVTRKYWLHLETAIPSTLRMVSPSYEVLRVQYYWNTVSAAACSRKHWRMSMDGIHRCRHDHVFARTIYDQKNMTTERRVRIAGSATHEETVELRNLVGLDTEWNPKMKEAPKEFDVRMSPQKKK